MYRLLSASKDTYITNKYIGSSRSLNSNVGQAGTLDLFKLFGETSVPGITSSVTELTRLLIKFDYSEIQALTGSILDFTSSSFKAAISLKDVYGGQTTPSNYTLELLPLSKSFEEGRGQDVVSFRDLDAANWVSASKSPLQLWETAGAKKTGSLGDTCDVIVTGNLGNGNQGLGVTQKFKRGDENLSIDVTHLVSASLAGIIPNNGFRISFIAPEENDNVTRFAKRFGSRHTFNKNLHPKLIVTYNDFIIDPGSKVFFDTSSSLYVYNIRKGNHINFISGSTEISGANSLKMELISSKSVKFTTSSFSPSHNKTISYLTRSLRHFSRSFSGGSVFFGDIPQTGMYKAPFNLSLVEDSELKTFMSKSNERVFKVKWKSLDDTVTYATNFVTIKRPQGDFSNVMHMNLVVNITNLQDEYNSNEKTRLRVFVSDYNQEAPGFRVPTQLDSVTIPDMRWRLVKAFTRDVVIPWGTGTRMSTDKDGMYFDMFFGDLDTNEVYEFEFLIKNTAARDHTITNKGFRFKLVK